MAMRISIIFIKMLNFEKNGYDVLLEKVGSESIQFDVVFSLK